MSRFSADWGNYQERAHRTERDTAKYHEAVKQKIRVKALDALDAFDLKEGLINQHELVDRSGELKVESPTRYVKRPYSPITRPAWYNYGQATTRGRSQDAQMLERHHKRTMDTRATSTHTFYTANMCGQWSILDPIFMTAGNGLANVQPMVPDWHMQENAPYGYRPGDLSRGYVAMAETVDHHLVRRSTSMPLMHSGTVKTGTWRPSAGLQKSYFEPKESPEWVGSRAAGAPTVIRPTRAQLLRTAHVQTALTELQDEDQKEQVRMFNMKHNGQWRDVYAAEEEPTPPYPWEWVENPKKRSAVEGATLELLKELNAYLAKRKIRIKEMFQPYCAFGPGVRVDPETLLQALHRFHLAEDLDLNDVLSVMLCFDPRCNGTVLLTDMQLLMDRVAKLPPPAEERAPDPLTGQSGAASSLAAVSPSHKLFGSSFKRFLAALDESVPRDKPKHSTVAGRSSMAESRARSSVMMESA